MNAHEFLAALAVVLGVAAIVTVVSQKLRQPVVLGYILAGLLVGPFLHFPMVADVGTVKTLAEFGVILLMFSLGLEFSLRKLLRVGPNAVITAIFECSIMLWLGFVISRALGWNDQESIFAGAVLSISSTTIVAKVFDEQKVKPSLRQQVVGVLIVEDLIAILLMAVLTAISAGSGLSAGKIALTTARLAAFLIGLIAIGLLVVPRAIRAIQHLNRAETSLVASIGICFSIALLAQEFGYSVALGAFVAGSLVAESGEAEHIEQLITPVRDMFAAIFFVSVGMMLNPQVLIDNWAIVIIFTLAVIVGKTLGVSVGSFLSGKSVRASVQAGMSLAQIGEFSFIIAGLGLSSNSSNGFLYPIAVSVSAITTLTTPWLIRASEPFASYVERKLPRPVQTFAALYGSWLERLKIAQFPTHGSVRRCILLLLLDAAFIASIVIVSSLQFGRVSNWLQTKLHFSYLLSRIIPLVLAMAFTAPFAAGIFRVTRRLGILLAEAALPTAAEGKLDLASAPRKAFVVALQLLTLLIVAIPLMTLTQPFLPGAQGGVLLIVLVILLAVAFWKTTSNLQGHVKAGAEVIVQALASQSKAKTASRNPSLDQVRCLLPGLGEPIPVEVLPLSMAVGKSLAQLNIRGLTGATILAINRKEGSVALPSAKEIIQDGDILALAGTQEAIESAKLLLTQTTRTEECSVDTG